MKTAPMIENCSNGIFVLINLLTIYTEARIVNDTIARKKENKIVSSTCKTTNSGAMIQ